MHQAAACPGCGAQFRVTAAQLMMHGGDVRCGRCGCVFNAYENPVAPAPAPLPAPVAAPPPPPAAATVAPPALPDLPRHTGGGAGSTRIEPALDTASVLRQAADQDWSPPPSITRTASPRPARPPARHGRRVTRGVLLATALLAVPAALLLARHEIASRQPALKAPLAALAAPLGLDVHFVKDAALVKLVSSGLEEVSGSSGLQLVFLLRNEADYWLAYPLVRLVLLDERDRIVEEQEIAPARYAALDPRGLPPRGEWEARVSLQPKTAGVAGYRLLLRTPP